jgi:hypothetical protein
MAFDGCRLDGRGKLDGGIGCHDVMVMTINKRRMEVFTKVADLF